MKKNKILFIGILVLILIAILSFSFLDTEKKYIKENCPDYEFNPGFVDLKEFIDCKNSIGIEKYVDENNFIIFNQSSSNLTSWDSFYVTNYFIFNDKIFYIENTELNQNLWRYFNATENPNNVKNLSVFRILDTHTGKITLYNILENIPENERNIFQQLLE